MKKVAHGSIVPGVYRRDISLIRKCAKQLRANVIFSKHIVAGCQTSILLNEMGPGTLTKGNAQLTRENDFSSRKSN